MLCTLKFLVYILHSLYFITTEYDLYCGNFLHDEHLKQIFPFSPDKVIFLLWFYHFVVFL